MSKEEKKFGQSNSKEHRVRRKGQNRRDSLDDRRYGESKVKPLPKTCMNDPMWYVIHPDLLKDVASLPFSHWLGDGIPVPSSGSTTAREATILKIPYTYTLGVASKADDPVNLAIRNLYTYVRHQNSGHANYEAADLGMYLLATGALIATLAHIERCIGVAKYYQRRSRVVPRQLCDALGVNLPSFEANLANYTARLNILWQRVSSLCIPKDFKFIQRWIWMNSQVFKDHESDKACLIVFKPVSVPLFDATLSSRGGVIQQRTYENATPDIINFFLDAETLANSILEDEDMNIISGDILKAYGFENLMTFGMTSLDYIVEPVYVEEMLPQVQHLMSTTCVVYNGPSYQDEAPRTAIPYDVAQIINDVTDPLYAIAQDDNNFTIYQVDGVIVCAPCQKGMASAATIDTTSKVLFWAKETDLHVGVNNADKVLNSYKLSVPPEDVILSTRLMFTEFVDNRITSSPVFINSCGTELVGKPTIYYAYKGSNGLIGKGSANISTHFVLESSLNNYDFIQTMLLGSQVDWSPFVYVDQYVGGTYVSNAAFFGDIDNFTAISPETLRMMHTNAVLAEFNVAKYNLIQ